MVGARTRILWGSICAASNIVLRVASSTAVRSIVFTINSTVTPCSSDISSSVSHRSSVMLTRHDSSLSSCLLSVLTSFIIGGTTSVVFPVVLNSFSLLRKCCPFTARVWCCHMREFFSRWFVLTCSLFGIFRGAYVHSAFPFLESIDVGVSLFSPWHSIQ